MEYRIFLFIIYIIAFIYIGFIGFMIAKKCYKKNKKNANELDEISIKRKNDNKTNQKKKLNNSLDMQSDLIDAINE